MRERSGTPFYFGPCPRALFGWYHPAPAALSRGVGIVLCNTVGNEAIGAAQKTLRYVADQLAEDGFSVLRFEFHGNGDSSGYHGDPDRVPTWLDDVDFAIAELRMRAGVEKIGLVGLRLGATLAAAAAARRSDVSSLVLWDPYYRGKRYVSEMSALHKVFEVVSAIPAKRPEGLTDGKEALGFHLSASTIAALEKIDLSAAESQLARTVRITGANRSQAAGGEACQSKLRAFGTDVQWTPLADHLCRDIQLISHEDHRLIAADLAAQVIDAHQSDAKGPGANPKASQPEMISPDNERPVLFGEHDALFGVLTSPPAGLEDAERPVVITMVQRLGPIRNYVRMARELGKLGYHVLRLDLSGRGDSLVADPREEESPYPIRALEDLKDAMTFLEKRVGAKRFIFAGLCSGADIAYQGGLIDDPRVTGILMINPRTFALYNIPELETLLRSQDLGRFVGKFFDRKNWLKLLRGEFTKGGAVGKFDTKGPLGKLADAVKLKFQSRREERGDGGSDKPSPSGLAKSVPGGFRKLADRGAKTLLVVRQGDLGISFVDANCGKSMRALESSKGFRRVTIKDVDHNFTTMYAQQELIRAVTEHFSGLRQGH